MFLFCKVLTSSLFFYFSKIKTNKGVDAKLLIESHETNYLILFTYLYEINIVCAQFFCS